MEPILTKKSSIIIFYQLFPFEKGVEFLIVFWYAGIFIADVKTIEMEVRHELCTNRFSRLGTAGSHYCSFNILVEKLYDEF